MRRLFSGWRRDLGLQILTLYVLFLLPILISGGIFDVVSGQRLRRDAMAADLSLSRAIAQETDTILTSALFAVEQLGAYEGVIDANNDEMLSLFSEFYTIRMDVNLVYRLDTAGTMIYHYPEGPSSTLGNDFSFRNYYQRAITTTDSLISLGRISPTTEQAVATAIYPLWDGDEFLGLVGTNMRLSSFSETMASISAEHHPDQKFEVLILDAGGKVIAHPEADKLLVDVYDLLPGIADEFFAGEEGNLIRDNGAGEEYLYSMVQVQRTDWAVVVGRPTSVAFAASIFLHRSLMILVIVFAGIGLFFWLALSQRMLRPLEALAAYSRAIGSSVDLSDNDLMGLKKIGGRFDQLGHLMRSFQRMEADVQARFDELATLLDTSAAVVSTLDSRDVLNRILEQVERLLGFNMSAILALDEDASVFRAVASFGLSDNYAKETVIAPDEPNSVTMRALKLGKPLMVIDTETDPGFEPFRERARTEGYRSYVAIPLHTTYAPPAALVVYSPSPMAFSERELGLLSNFANHAAMAIENAELYARSDARLQEEKRRLEALIESLESGLLLEDLNGQVLYANRNVSELAGVEPDALVGEHVRTFYLNLMERTRDSDKVRDALADYLENSKQRFSLDIAFERADGVQYFRMQGFVVTDFKGRLIGRGQFFRDITRRYELDRMKSSLIATVSHELRTPLAAIKGYATTLLADDVEWDQDSEQEFLEIISMEADRLGELVTNLLDMSRIEAGDLTLSRAAVQVVPMIDLAIQRAFPKPNLDLLYIEAPEKLSLLYADGQRIEVVLRNLIENAVKYSSGETPIWIRVEETEEEMIFSVEDRGPGIPKNEQQQVFSSFYRMQRDRVDQVTGVGLGLAISRGFIEAHKGRIWFEPIEEGTCVVFALPVHIEDEENEDISYLDGVSR